VFVVDFDADGVEWAYGFAYAAVGAFLWVYVDYWAPGFLSLLFGLFFCFDGFSGAYGFADFAVYALGFVQCQFVVSGVQKSFYGELVFVVCFQFFDRHLAPISLLGCWVMWVENIFTNVNAHKKLAFQR
jgi:hypothetical protein